MTDFNNQDNNNIQEKADEVVSNAEAVINEAEAAKQPEQPQPEQTEQHQPEQPQNEQPQQTQYGQPYQQPQQPQYGQPPYGQQPQQPQQPQYGQPPYGQQPQQPQYGQPPYGQQPQQPQYGQPPYGQPQYNPYNQQPQGPMGYEQKSKIVAGLLGIFLGSIGIHNFYLGFTTRAIIQIVVSVVTCGIGGLWGFIEGILILCGNYNNNVDANGVPLKE